MKILMFGEILWDVFPEEKCLGGAPLNCGAHLVRHGEDVYMVSSVGGDALGTEALKMVKKWGMSDKYITVLDGIPTGRCNVTLDESGVPSYDLIRNVAWDNISCKEIDSGFDALYFGTLSLRGEENFAELRDLLGRHSFENVFADVNIRAPFSTAEAVHFVAENAHIIKISDEEMPVVAEMLGISFADCRDFARSLSERYENLRLILLTLGDKGAMVLDCTDGKIYSCPAVPAKVVSTVGAGDSFSAAFLSRYKRGSSIEDALSHAARVASFVVSEKGAVPEYDIADFE